MTSPARTLWGCDLVEDHGVGRPAAVTSCAMFMASPCATAVLVGVSLATFAAAMLKGF